MRSRCRLTRRHLDRAHAERSVPPHRSAGGLRRSRHSTPGGDTPADPNRPNTLTGGAAAQLELRRLKVTVRDRHRRLDLPAVARQLLPARPRPGEGAGICRGHLRRDRDQRDLLRPPAPASWAKWAEAAPDGFEFAIKASRFCVTRPKLADAGEGIGNFLRAGADRARRPSSARCCGCCRGTAQFDRDDIAAFFDLLPARARRAPAAPRHRAAPRKFSRRALSSTSRRGPNVAVVFGDDDEFPCIDADTAEFRLRPPPAHARGRCRRAMTTPRSTRSQQRARRWSERRPRQLPVHDQRRQAARPRRGAGAAAAARHCAALSAAPSRAPMRTDQQPLRLTLFAPKGRMGRAIAAAVEPDGRCHDRPRPWRRAGRFLLPRRASVEPRPRDGRRHPDPGRDHRADRRP